MGHVSWYDLGAAIRDRGCRHFVETGTGQGSSLQWALGYPFETFWSVDIDPTAIVAAHRLAPRTGCPVNLTLGESVPFLGDVCRQLPAATPALFWLDAHFPGCFRDHPTWGEDVAEEVRLPLYQELEVIAAMRCGSDVILIDDLRIYTDLSYQHGGLPEHLRPLCPRDRTAGFIRDLLGSTHEVTFSADHEGYALLVPRNPT